MGSVAVAEAKINQFLQGNYIPLLPSFPIVIFNVNFFLAYTADRGSLFRYVPNVC
jgi:hypothetical protein